MESSRTFDSHVKFIRAQDGMLKNFAEGAKEIHATIAREAKIDMKEKMRGELKSKTLRKMGYPFARSKGKLTKGQRGARDGGNKGYSRQVTRKGTVKRLPLNYQTGELYRGVTLDYKGGRSKKYELYSTAPHEEYILDPKGTKFMVGRGLTGQRGELIKLAQLRRSVMLAHWKRKLGY